MTPAFPRVYTWEELQNMVGSLWRLPELPLTTKFEQEAYKPNTVVELVNVISGPPEGVATGYFRVVLGGVPFWWYVTPDDTFTLGLPLNFHTAETLQFVPVPIKQSQE